MYSGITDLSYFANWNRRNHACFCSFYRLDCCCIIKLLRSFCAALAHAELPEAYNAHTQNHDKKNIHIYLKV